MSKKEQKLKINQEYKLNSNEVALGNDINHIEKNIEALKNNISELENQRETELGELADEKNYDLFFYLGGALVLLNLIFNFNLLGFIVAIVFGVMFFVYVNFFNKKKRNEKINADFDKDLDDLKENLAEREEEIKKTEGRSGKFES